MKILIATGIYPPDIGGPAQYAKNLADEFAKKGNKVKVLAFGLGKKLPTGIRHLFYFCRIVLSLSKVDFIVVLDTFSAGWPAVLAAKIFGKKTVLRTGGDFLWESYVEDTGRMVLLGDFYNKLSKLPLKQKIIKFLQNFVLKNCSVIIFSTEFQKIIFEKAYGLDEKKLFIVENFYPIRNKISNGTSGEKLKEKKFLWAGRFIKFKNIEIMEKAFNKAKKEKGDIELEISKNIAHEELENKIRDCYAVIYPSLTEISPNFILDAIGFNKPFITTRDCGFYEKMKDIGVFVDPLDMEDIKNKILFLADEKNYQEYKKRVENFNFTHSWEEIADEFLRTKIM